MSEAEKVRAEISDTLNEDAAAVRRAVFMDEQGFENEFDETDGISKHIVLYDGDIPAAVCRVYTAADGCGHIGRIAVIKPYRGKGLGNRILSEAEKLIANMGMETSVLSAQERASGFYTANGYEKFGDIYYDEYCPHIKMKKKLSKRTD